MLKVICFADRRPRGGIAHWLEKYSDADLIVTLGDLSWPELMHLCPEQKLKIGVHGNHDGDEDEFIDAGIRNLHTKSIQIGDWTWAGIEGSPRYKRGNYQYSQEEMADIINEVIAADIIITHTPPAGIHDSSIPTDQLHQGWSALRSYVLEFQPKLVLHGHTYPDRRESILGNTVIHYVNGVSVLNISEHSIELVDTDLQL